MGEFCIEHECDESDLAGALVSEAAKAAEDLEGSGSDARGRDEAGTNRP
jgi:hypothetical protein